MKFSRKTLAFSLVACMMMSLAISASATNMDPRNEDDYTQSAPATRVDRISPEAGWEWDSFSITELDPSNEDATTQSAPATRVLPGVDGEQEPFPAAELDPTDEDATTQSAPATRVTLILPDVDGEQNSPATEIDSSDENASAQSDPATRGSRISPDVGHGTGEWNSFFNWGRAITESWSWARATYLYASATVSADGCTDESASVSSTSKQKVTTDKVYQTVTDGRVLYTEHTVEGYWGDDTELKTEYYYGTFEF